MIDEPGHPTGNLRDRLDKELAMLKTISAALLAVSVIAAPVMAASTTKIAQTPVTKSSVIKSSVTKSATVTPSAHVKKNPLNANAKIGRHQHVSHYRHHHLHQKMAAKAHKSLKVSAKPVMHPAKRG
jgi:hypothetical protein